MRTTRVIHVVSCHAEGEVGDVIVGGVAAPPGATLWEHRYLMGVTDGWPTVAKMTSDILEADALTGPWRMVAYLKDFGEQAYFLNFPSKFISADGRTLWLCYSANFSPGRNGVELKVNPPGGRYGLCLHEVKLLGPREGKPRTVNPAPRPPPTACPKPSQ